MKIKNVRVDARGIHGQVATAWVQSLDINRILVIDDKVINNDMQKMALKMACPMGVKLSIFSCKRAVERLNDSKAYIGEKLMIILINVETLATLDQLGFRFTEVNIGNIPSRPNTQEVRKTIYITEDEKKTFLDLGVKGTLFTAQMVPNDSVVNFLELLN
jgi:PTS system mannose-specific IIB component